QKLFFRMFIEIKLWQLNIMTLVSLLLFSKIYIMSRLCFLILFSISFLHSSAQIIVQRDPEIEQMVKEISADSLKSYITKLVTFGTRSTLSSTTDKNRGIGAARNWVLSKFNEFAKQSKGRLTAFVDTITLQPDRR